MTIPTSTTDSRYAFGKYDRILIEGRAYQFVQRTEEGFVLRQDDTSGLCNTFSNEFLARISAAGRLRQEIDYYLPEDARRRLTVPISKIAELEPMQRVRHDRRSAYVAAFCELYAEGRIKKTEASIKTRENELIGLATKLCDRSLAGKSAARGKADDVTRAPSAKTILRWVKQDETDGPIGLCDSWGRSGNSTGRLHPEVQSAVTTSLRRYMTCDRPSIKSVHEHLHGLISSLNCEREKSGTDPLPYPSIKVITTAIKKLDCAVVTAARKGSDVARKNFRPVTSGVIVTRPLERVEIDSSPVDLMTFMTSVGLYELLTEEERVEIGLDGSKSRWTLTLALCCATRCIVGLSLSRKATSEAALHVLEMIVSDKGQWADNVGSLSPWDMYGIPETIVTDCGNEYRSSSFRNACADLGCILEHAIAGTPEQRGRGERMFRTVGAGVCTRLSGRTFSDIATKGDADPAKRTALTIEDLNFCLIRWVVDIYHNTKHGGLGGKTPLETWRKLANEWGVRPPPDMDTRRLVFGRSFARKVSKKGIVIFGIHYHSEALAKLFMRDENASVDIRWHPRDIGKVLVQIGGGWHEVPSSTPGFDGVDAQTWLAANRQERARDPGSRKRQLDIVLAAARAISERNESAMKATGLVVEHWDEARMDREEARLFAQISFVAETLKQVAPNGIGQSLPAATDELEASVESEEAVPARVKATASSKARKSSKAVTKPTGRQSGGNTSQIEEN